MELPFTNNWLIVQKQIVGIPVLRPIDNLMLLIPPENNRHHSESNPVNGISVQANLFIHMV